MIKLIAAAGFALALATSAQAMTPLPLAQPDSSVITQIAFGCGVGRARVGGVCVARTTRRQVRRHIRRERRCLRWSGTVCRHWGY